MHQKNIADRDIYLKHLKSNLLRNQVIGAGLLFIYCAVYGVTANLVLASWQILYFVTSILFAVSAVYIKDKQIKNIRLKKCVIVNQLVGTAIIVTYILFYGFSSFALLTGFQLAFFMSSYVFAISLIYIHNKRVIEANNIVSYSSTMPLFVSKPVANLSQEDLYSIICDINNSLTIIVGFSELMLRRDYKSNEKDYMIREIFEQAISISHGVTKITSGADTISENIDNLNDQITSSEFIN
jgi:signal transduction histidine kinase